MGQVCSGASEESHKGGLLDVPSDTGDYADSSLLEAQRASGVDPKTTGDGREGDGNGETTTNNSNNSNNETTLNETEGQKAASAALAALERRKRRELWIVNGAARGMVAVRSTRGSTGYYDQGFAGLLAQHLEQTTSFPNKLPLVLPEPAPLKPTTQADGTSVEKNSNNNNSASSPSKGLSPSKDTPTTPAAAKKCTFYDRLAQPQWEGMELVVDDSSSRLRGREASAAASGDPHKLMDALAESLLDGPYTVLPAKQQLFAGVQPMVENLL
jgi:hypothetical protein